MRRLIQVPVLAIVFLLVCASAALASEVDVNTTKDAAPSDSECSGVPGDCSLRQAIDKAQPGDTVALPGSSDNPAVYTVTLGSTLSVNKTLAIQGNGPSAAIIDGSANDGGRFNEGFRILTVGGGQVTLSGITFRNGSDGNDEQFQFCSPCETLNANGGGAVFNNGASVALDNVAFTGDSAPVGGAVSNGAGGTLTMTDVSFTDNGGGIGGALFTHNGSVTGTGVTFENNGNGSFGGGAAYLGSGTVNLTNTTIVGNGWASTFGGGIDNAGATLTLLDDTFSGNVRGAIETDDGITKVGSTIIGAGFSDGSDFACVAAGKRNNNDFTTSDAITTDLGDNIDEDGHCNLSNPSDRSGVNADLAPIADNGGPTRTQALLSGSPALGDPSSSNCPDVDQRGFSRPTPRCDIGAFEAVINGPPSTPSTADARNVTDTSADLAGTIDLNGEAGGFHFVYGTARNDLSHRSDEVAAGVAPSDTAVVQTLSNLTPDTTYYYTIVADNASDSMAAENIQNFTTQPGPPVIGDQVGVDSITDTTATVHFSINPQGSDTTYFVEYGPDSNYGQQTKTVDIGSAPGAQSLSATLTGLDPGSTVHFDIVAGNDVQPNVDSGDRSFDTLQQITGLTGQLVEVNDGGRTFFCPTPDHTTVGWGDDSSETHPDIQCTGGGEGGAVYELSDSHIYTAPGDYQITINYADLGGETDVVAHISANPDGLTNTGPPSISGSLHEGQTLTTTDGDWEGNPTGFDYRWQDCDANGQNCTDTGEDANSYTLTADDLGRTIRVIVTASNDTGYSDSVSDPTAPVLPPAPTNTVPPAITGAAQQGGTLTTTDGTWDGNPTRFDYQWQDCDASGQHCANTGTDTATYALTSSDVGHTIQVIVTATGDSGSAHATSNRTAVVAAAAGSPPPSSQTPTTSPSSPTVGAANAQTVTITTAGFSGSVTPNGLPTQAHFEYGLDPRYSGGGPIVYDQSTPAQPVGSDFASHGVGPVAISGLLPNALYHVRLVASNSAGTTFGPDATFTTAAAPAPSAPILGKTVNVTPVSGFVLIKIDGKFVPLTGAEQIPSGAQIDARHGSLELITSTGRKGKTQHGTFGGAIFMLIQQRAGRSKGLVTLSLVEGAFKGAPSFALCKAHKAADATIASTRTLQLLKASAHGKFRTKGRYSAATVRGTKWTIADRCDGTLTHDITHSVAITDFVRHKTIILHAGQSYLARSRKTA